MWKNFELNKYFLSFIFVFAFFLASTQVKATHDVGGNIAYEFLGDPDGDGLYTYRITLTTYQDCQSIFWFTNPGGSFPLPTQQIGVYEGGANDPVLNRVRQPTLSLLDSTRIEISLPSGCPSPPASVCVYEVRYRGTVDLPISLLGYHFVFDKCCRNILTNILSPQPPSTGGSGIVYHAWTSGPLTQNSSPVFTDLSVPFICVGDTTPILNTATDPDGNQLLFSFEKPYDGLAQNTGFQPPLVYNWPPSTVTYFNNYSETAPFGPGGYAFLNAFTGYTEYFTPTAGSFGITVQIKELNANGNLVGLSRRHYQFQALQNCPVNKTPRLSSIGSSGQTIHSVEEGDTLCFDVSFIDPDGDSLNFNSSIIGAIFNSSITNPTATASPFGFGDSTATSEFCWQTGCAQGRSLPYQFTATVKDDGCYPREASAVYQITVNDFVGPTSITGPTSVCAGSSGITYATDSISGANYQWTVIGGTQVAGSNSNRIQVDWGNGPGGTVLVRATSAFGCPSDPIDIAVNVLNFPFDAGTNKSICAGDSVQIGGSPTAPTGFTIKWTPAASLSNDTLQNPFAFPNTTTTYRLQITDTQGCRVVDSVRVDVASPPNAFVQGDTTICSGDIFQLRSGGGTTYSWSPATGLSAVNVPNPTVNITTSQTYRVRISDATSLCAFEDSVRVNVFNPSSVNAGADTSICLGESLILGGNPTSTGNARYLWTPNVNLNSDTLSNPVFSPGNDGVFTFRVDATLNFGCTASDSIVVQVNPLPVVQALANRLLICEKDTTQLRAQGALSYLWNPIHSLSDSIGSTVVASPKDTTLYIVIGEDINGCRASDSVQIDVQELPEIISDSLLFLCSGDTIEIEASRGSAISYSWQAFPGINFLGPLNLQSTRASHSVPGDTLLVQLNASRTNLANCVALDTCVLIVDTLVPTDAGPDTSFCFPDSLVLGGNPTGFAGTLFSWTNFRMNDSTLANPKVRPEVSFNYVVNTRNGSCVGRDSTFISVLLKPDVHAIPDSADFCVGESVQINTNVLSGNITRFRWFPSDSLSSDTVQNPIANPIDTSIYTLTAFDGNGCFDRDTVFIAVYSSPPINIYDTTICAGDTMQYFNNPNFNYLWSPAAIVDNPNANNPRFFPNDTILIKVEVSNTSGCFGEDSAIIRVIPQPNFEIFSDTAICLGDTANLRSLGATPTSLITWSPSTGLDNPASFNPKASPSLTTLYTAVLTNGGICPAVKSLQVQVNPIPQADAGIDTSLCLGASIQLRGTGGVRFSWSPGNFLNDSNLAQPIATLNAAQAFELRVFDAIGCSDIDSVTIGIHPLPFVDAGPDRVVCELGDTAVLGGNPSALPGTFTTWNNHALLDNSNSANPRTTVLGRRSFLLQVTDSNSCRNADTVIVDVFNLELGPMEDQCPGVEYQIPAPELIGTAPYSYQWSPGSAFIDSSLASPVLKVSNSTVYQVVVVDSNQCSDTAEFELFVKNGPQARFNFEILADCDDAVLLLEDNSIDADSIQWIFGNEVSKLPESEFRIDYNQDFEVSLLAWREACPDTSKLSSGVLSFEDYFQLSPPNVFTPNFDGINDLFEVNKGNRLYNCTQVYIYNRWGQLMFASQGPNHAWDGRTFAGEEVSEGVYFYVVEVNGVTTKGQLSLIR